MALPRQQQQQHLHLRIDQWSRPRCGGGTDAEELHGLGRDKLGRLEQLRGQKRITMLNSGVARRKLR